MRKLTAFALLLTLAVPSFGQRVTDKLDRGLIALPAQGGGYLVSWRLLAEEYYDVTYNVYRDGTRIAEGLDVSNFRDTQGSKTSTYTVSAVVNGQEQTQCEPVKAWSTTYREIKLKHEGIRSTLIPNDACCADVDGDGELEILMKFDNLSEMEQSYPKEGPVVGGVTTGEYSIFEIFKLDGTRLWWVNCGPNMGDFQNNEQNIVGYDWNQDGKAEVVMRLEEGSSIHMADGTVYTIGANGQNGTSWYNFRGATGGGVNWFMHDGKEFLVYCNGQTGEIFDIIDYPLARLEPGETSLEAAWGDGYGHRSSKYFFGAPYLDGRNPSIFLARGIYTQIKMCALDVNKATNKLVKRWDWRQTNGGYWMWQGYHNFGVADVDEDGRDEIVYGSMVIDDCGKGLSTTGFGHGDAQHCSDFNPYTKGLEIYACNEDQPGNNYRDATTSKVYHRFNAGNDDGRAMMGNFTDDFPGSIGCSAREGAISSVTYAAVDGMTTTGINTNFRIYWDGDLCSETFNYLNGKNTEGCVAKYGSWSPIYTCTGSMTNNDTKGTPCYQGDILGDWREEIIMRDANNNVRIYSSPVASPWRIPTLWSDHQYRNAMVWQMCGYNQPPHLSYFLGKLEGLTVAPPPLTMNGREEVANGGKVDASFDGKHVIVCETNDTELSMADGIKPQVLTFNVPSWVKGTAGTNYTAKEAKITYDYYTCTVTSGSLAGSARLVKQGDGVLCLPKTEMTHTGETNVWAGVLNFDGTMRNSDLWINRFAELNSDGGVFKSIKADYASVVRPGGENKIGTITSETTFTLGFGSRLVVELDGTNTTADQIVAKEIILETKDWKAGPQYMMPVIEVKGLGGAELEAGKYLIGTCTELTGSLTTLKVEGVTSLKSGLSYEDGKIYLTLGSVRGASHVVWTGAESNVWDYATSANFSLYGEEEAAPEVFVSGDLVDIFDGDSKTTIELQGDIRVDSLRIKNESLTVTINGPGAIVEGAFVKEGAAKTSINSNNTYMGGNFLRGGTVMVKSLSNSIQEYGALGAVTTSTAKFRMENGAILNNTAAVKNGSPIMMVGELGGVIQCGNSFEQEKAISGTLLTKTGGSALTFGADNSSLKRLVVKAGTVTSGFSKPAQTVELQGGTLNLNGNSDCAIEVAEGKTATLNLNADRGTYSNKLTGSGTLTVYYPLVKGSGWNAARTALNGDWSGFSGTLKPVGMSGDQRFVINNSKGMPNATMSIASGVTVLTTGQTVALAAVTGPGTLGGYEPLSQSGSGTSTWNVGNESDFSFEGKVSGSAIFNKLGDGTMTTSGVWDNTGAVAFKGGKVKMSGSATFGSGKLTVNSGVSLVGTSGTTAGIKNSSVVINGTIIPGTTETTGKGTIRFNGQKVTIGTTGTLRLGVYRASTSDTELSGSDIANVGTLELNGTLELFFVRDFVPAAGDEIRLWTSVSKVTGTPKIVTEGLDIEFDLGRLSEGVLVVKSSTGIGQTMAPAEASAVYTISGQRVLDTDHLPAGIYIRGGRKFVVK